MGLVRQHFYVPDGEPPPDWDAVREGSILKQLLKRGSSAQVAVWIEGAALLRDQPGFFGEDEVKWLPPPGQKITARVLLKRSGTATMQELAHRAYWTHANRRPRGAPTTTGPVPLSALVPNGVRP
jgi:hypothetical protein